VYVCAVPTSGVRGSRCEVGYVATGVDIVDSTVDGKECASFPN
jgi:hypothetical protein